MIELIKIYKWTIVSGAFSAFVLTQVGAQLATRGRAMQTLCVGQGATLGVLLGMALCFPLGGMIATAGPLASAVAFSIGTLLVSDRLVAGRVAARDTHFTFLFALLLACSYLVSSAFAALESHMAQIYFGDLATMTTTQAQLSLAFSVLAIVLLARGYRAVSNGSFETAVFGQPGSSSRNGSEIAFQVLAILVLALSVQFLGFLFTIAMLFVPTTVMNLAGPQPLRRYLVLCGVQGAVGTIVGFVLSLQFTRLPTVPMVVVSTLGIGLALVGIEGLRQFFKEKKKAGESYWGWFSDVVLSLGKEKA